MDSRRYSFTNMRAIAAMAIVLLHTAQYNADVFDVKGVDKIASFAIRNGMLWAVPLFCMITGALWLNPEHTFTYKRLFLKYILRALLLLFLSVLVCQIADNVMGLESAVDIKALPGKVIYDSITMGGWKPLWYLYLLIALYVSMPAFHWLASSAEKKDIGYLIGVLFLFQSVIPCIAHLTGFSIGFYSLFYTIYPLYLLLGYWWVRYFVIESRRISWIAGMAILCFLAQIILTAGCFRYGWLNLFEEMSLYSFPLVVVLSSAIFLWMDRCANKEIVLFSMIDKYTLDIYLIHLLLLRIAMYGIHFNPYTYGLGMMLAEAVGLFFLSLVIAKSIRSVLSVFVR